MNLDKIQGNVLRGARWLSSARYAFYSLGSGDTKAFLCHIRPLVTPESEMRHKPDVIVNVAFTYAGLFACGIDYDPTDRYVGESRNNAIGSDAFKAGMKAARKILSDQWKDDHPHWWSADWDCEREDPPHLLVWITAKTARLKNERYANIRKRADDDGIRELGYQDAQALDGNKEHFGFVDGVSQPAIAGIKPTRSGVGKISGRGWEPLALGEFLLGHPDEGNPWPLPLPKPESVTRDGTFLVYRKLYQSVAAFREFLKNNTASEKAAARLAEALMGRQRNGEPLMPRTPGASGVDERNAFHYKDDPHGYRCSLGAHVRRANPRDDLHFEGRLTNRHRIIRRGMPYGEELGEGEDDGSDRGLIFIAFNARIEDQFEFIQRAWLNGGRPFRIGSEPDVIAGNPTSDGPVRVVANGEPPILASVDRPFVEFRGGEYFLMPALRGLDAIIESAP